MDAVAPTIIATASNTVAITKWKNTAALPISLNLELNQNLRGTPIICFLEL